MHTTLSSVWRLGALLLVLNFAPQADAIAPANPVTAGGTGARSNAERRRICP